MRYLITTLLLIITLSIKAQVTVDTAGIRISTIEVPPGYSIYNMNEWRVPPFETYYDTIRCIYLISELDTALPVMPLTYPGHVIYEHKYHKGAGYYWTTGDTQLYDFDEHVVTCIKRVWDWGAEIDITKFIIWNTYEIKNHDTTTTH